jgi:hypothetical protein
MIKILQFKIFRYGLISVIGYVWVLLLINLLNNRFSNLQSSIIAYGSWYGIQFILQKQFIFDVVQTDRVFIRYLIFLVSNYILVVILHNTFLLLIQDVFHSVLLTAICIFPLRYYILNKWVYG